MQLTEFEEKLNKRGFIGNNSKEIFETAHKWAKKQNEKSKTSCLWSWDCGLKLDYDGEICMISSRFYPPHKSSEEYGKYHGYITVYVQDSEIHKKEIEANTLQELKTIVEDYISKIEEKIITNIKAVF